MNESEWVPEEARILLVDDQQANLALLEAILHEGGFHSLWSTKDPREVPALLSGFNPDLLLLDLHMPHIDGFGVLSQVQGIVPRGEYFPVLVLTADITPAARNRALAGGAKDFVRKPFDATEVLLRCRNLLETRKLHQQLSEHNRTLEAKVRERTRELEASQLEILDRLALAGDFRDDITGSHARRVGTASAELAAKLALPDRDIEVVRLAAPLHDLGKIGIADAILHKPDRLTAEEFSEVKKHTELGGRLLSGSNFAILRVAEDIARHHHERWDGSGYSGLRGESISVFSRIVSVADVFDALVHVRPYKQAWPHDQALAEIARGRGTHFCPEVVDAFVAMHRDCDSLLEAV